MLLLYDLLSFLSYFLIMIIFMVIAIATAKKPYAWIWYVVGAIIQLMSLLGNQKFADVNGTNTSLHWGVYGVLLIITAIAIVMRNKKLREK